LFRVQVYIKFLILKFTFEMWPWFKHKFHCCRLMHRFMMNV